MDDESIYKLSFLQQQLQQIQENLAFLDREIEELDKFNKNLSLYSKEKENELFASLGKGVYLKALCDLNSKKELLVDVGANVLIKKTHEETSEVIIQQIKKLAEAKLSLVAKQEIYQKAFRTCLMTLDPIQLLSSIITLIQDKDFYTNFPFRISLKKEIWYHLSNPRTCRK